MDANEDAVTPQIVTDDAANDAGETYVTEPGRLIRIASMTRAMLEEVRESPLDEAGRHRLLAVYHSSLDRLRDSLSDDLRAELASIFAPLESSGATESELRIVQAQLVGWLEGLFSGIQASLFSQQAAAKRQLDEVQRSTTHHDEPGGTYL